MKKVVDGVVRGNNPLTATVYDLWLSVPGLFDGNGDPPNKAGQFVGVYVGKGEHLLPRPISLCETRPEEGLIRLVYQIAGQGTAHLAQATPGQVLRLIGPLGNGFRAVESDSHWLVGGGVGTPPLLEWAKTLRARPASAPCRIYAVLGFRGEPFLTQDFEPYCDGVYVATDDGRFGFHGNAVELLKQHLRPVTCAGETAATAALYACGPRVMLRALAAWAEPAEIPLQVSVEERMACGIGSCVGCAVHTRSDSGSIYKRACKDGPVFDSREVAL